MNAHMDQTGWAVIRITGSDRVKSLNNMCTQDIKRLNPGQSSETFITNLQGKTIGFCTVHLFEDELWIRSNPDSLKEVLQALNKYAIFDQSVIEDLTDTLDQLVVFGDQAIQSIRKSIEINPDEAIKTSLFELSPVYIFPDQSTGCAGIVLMGPKGLNQKIIELIEADPSVQVPLLTSEEYNRLRILNAWPNYNQDIRADNLPQEVDRNKTAIHFNKGCYLGQETVARLDALGHVNRLLMGFIWEPSEKSTDPETLVNRPILNEIGQQVGEIRSATTGFKTGQIIGLALIRLKALEQLPRISDHPTGSLKFMKLEEFRSHSHSSQ